MLRKKRVNCCSKNSNLFVLYDKEAIVALKIPQHVLLSGLWFSRSRVKYDGSYLLESDEKTIKYEDNV